MAFRIPVKFLNKDLQMQIAKDLHLTSNNKIKTFGDKEKSIDFFLVNDQLEVLMPYYYASQLFRTPLINRRRKYFSTDKWNFHPGFELFDYQVEVVQLAESHYKQTGTAFFNVFCSFGKTVVGAYLCSKFSQSNQLLSLVVYPRSTLEKSWTGTFKNLTTAKVHVVQGDEPIPDDVQVIICSDGRFKKLSSEILSRVGHLVIDEADLFCTAGHVSSLLSVEPLYLTLLTATYERDDGMHKMLDLMSGPEKITRISKKSFYVLHHPTGFIPENIVQTSRGIQYDSLVAQLDKIPERNQLICNLVFQNLSEKILVLTYHVSHAEQLAGYLSQVLTPYGKTVALLTGKVKSYCDSDILIGTRSKIGVGFDEKEVAEGWYRSKELGGQRRFNLLILASVGLKIEQIAGRVFRAPVPVIIDLVDNHPNTKKHYSQRKSWYQSRNGIIITIKEGQSACWKQILNSGIINV